MLGRHFGFFLLNLYGVIATSWRLWREVRRWKPTHLYVMNWMYFSYAAPAILMLRQPLIYRAGDMLPVHTGLHRWTCRLLFQRVGVLVCNSHFIAGRMRAIAPPGLVINIIHNYPPNRKTNAIAPAVKVPAGAAVIVFAGQIAEHKGVVVLVEAVATLIRQGRNLALLVAGESTWGGTLASRLQAQVRAEKLDDRIQFLGYVANVPGLLQQAHLHACPSMWEEPSPNVIMEAKLAGLPSVVFAAGGIPELIEHGVDGYVCQDWTVPALAAGIEFFLNNPEKRRLAGEAARRSLDEKFGEQRFRRAWAEVFRKVDKLKSLKS